MSVVQRSAMFVAPRKQPGPEQQLASATLPLEELHVNGQEGSLDEDAAPSTAAKRSRGRPRKAPQSSGPGRPRKQFCSS